MVDSLNAPNAVADLQPQSDVSGPEELVDTPDRAPTRSRPKVREWTEEIFVSRRLRYRKYRFRRD